MIKQLAQIALRLAITFLVIVETVIAPSQPIAAPAVSVPAKLSSVTYLVSEVVDGDTIKLSNGETVRLIGVDTPETVHPNKPVEKFGREASAFTKQLLLGKQVRLEYDQDTRDRYQRLLAYVYLPDGTSANEQIVASGFGYAYTQFPFKYMERYREIEKRARAQRRGLWADEPATPPQLPGSPAATSLAPGMAAAGLTAAAAAPAAAQQMVVITPTGKKYHTMSCRTVYAGTARQVPLSQAAASGYTACKICK